MWPSSLFHKTPVISCKKRKKKKNKPNKCDYIVSFLREVCQFHMLMDDNMRNENSKTNDKLMKCCDESYFKHPAPFKIFSTKT